MLAIPDNHASGLAVGHFPDAAHRFYRLESNPLSLGRGSG